MSQPKGKIPPHIKHKEFKHPKQEHQFVLILNQVDDPRKPSCNFRYSLVTILFVTFVGILCGAKDWEEIYQSAEGMVEWIGGYVDVSSGIPPSRTLQRVMSLIPTQMVERVLVDFGRALKEGDTIRNQGDTIAIDGKTLRGSRGWNENDRPLHLLHAWSVNHRLCLGQVSVDEKSNEVTALPKLLETLELRGTVITTDALNTQKGTAKVAVDKGADYILPVKGNHPTFHEEIELLFKEAEGLDFCGIDAAQSETLEKSGGRVESRSYALLDAEDLPGAKEWEGCRCVGRVIRTRTKNQKVSTEICYYATSLDLDIARFSSAVRDHWGVENGLHWSLDVIFKEDHHRYQDRIGAANLSLMRKIALAILSRDTTLKCGRAAKQMRAAVSSAFRDHLLKKCF
jgi:predicted transposase YbfD/YdcC